MTTINKFKTYGALMILILFIEEKKRKKGYKNYLLKSNL